MKHIDFFYFFGSVYAYLSVMRIGKLAQAAGVSVRWRPFNVRTVMKENNVALRSEANTACFHQHLKSTADRLDTTGRKLTQVQFDENIARYCLFKEAKIKGPFMLKSHIQKPAPLPWLVKPGGGGAAADFSDARQCCDRQSTPGCVG